MFTLLDRSNPKTLVRNGTILFVFCVIIAYSLYPHWTTLSHFATQWYTLIPYVIAMLIATVELWYLGYILHRNTKFRLGGIALYTSAACAVLILCVPYLGSAMQKDLHDAISLFFVLFAATGFASIAYISRNTILGILSGALYGICVLELVFLARYKLHPVYPWVWTILELSGIALLIASLYIVAGISEKKHVLSTGSP